MRTLPRPHRHDESVIPVATTRPRAIDAPRLACKPGTSRAVLDELRAETDRAFWAAFNRPAATGLPYGAKLRTVPLASVPVDDIETVLADIAAHVAAAPFVRHEPELTDALAKVAELLDGAL